MLKIQNITKTYPNGMQALKNVSFDVKDDEFPVVIGLSGSGKSTSLRCINRLIDPNEGKILWDGLDITAAPPAELRNIRCKIGMVFQQFNLIKRSCVMTNGLSGRLGYVNPWLSLVGVWPEDEKQKALRSLERLELRRKPMTAPMLSPADNNAWTSSAPKCESG